MGVIMVCATLFLFYCVVSFFSYKISMDKCSSVMMGVVTDVEKKNDTRHGYNDKAYVAPQNAPDVRLETPSTKHEYTKGESVKIYYDPNDSANYYIEGAEPTRKDLSMIITLLTLLIVGYVVLIVKGMQYRKLCRMQSELPD